MHLHLTLPLLAKPSRAMLCGAIFALSCSACMPSGEGATPNLEPPKPTQDAVPTASAGAIGGPVLHFALDELMAEADVIVRGRTQASKSAWDNEHRRIWTTWTVAVSEAFKGWEGSSELSLSVAGGTVGNRSSTVSGEFHPQPEQDYVFFLRRDPQGRLRMLGKAQGAFAITGEGDGAMVRNSFRGLRVLDRSGQPIAEKIGPIHMPLAELRAALGHAPTPELPPTRQKGQPQ